MNFLARILRIHTCALLFLGFQPLCVDIVFAADEHTYNITAGPLNEVLSRFGVEAGINIIGISSITDGKMSQGLRGTVDVETGLNKLLLGTGVMYQRQSNGGFTLQLRQEGILLPTQKVTGESLEQEEVYRAPSSSVYISSEDIQRFGVISVGDMLKGQPGVQVGDSRNGGGLDVNIRGIQGQSRVAVTVDGSQQALDVYRGYNGTQQRSYIDPDLISDVTIEKGPSLSSSAIGGTVKMRTLGIGDILKEGKNFGLRLKGDLWNNGVAPASRDPHSKTEDLYSAPHDSRRGIFGSKAESGSAAFAYTHDFFDVVAAYAHRNQGNYFTGTKGRDKYRTFNRYGMENNTVGKAYKEGEEVLNSSSETESILLKTTIRPADGHTWDLGYRRYDGRIGEIMPSEILRYGTAGIVQYPLGQTKIDTYTIRYNYLPSENPLLDLMADLWLTEAETNQLSSVATPKSLSYRTDRGWSRQANRRVGGGLTNSSRWITNYGDFKLDLGSGFQIEDLRPQKGVITSQNDIDANRMLRDATRQEMSFNAKLEFKPIERIRIWGGGRYTHYRTKDNVSTATARHEDRNLRYITVFNGDTYGNMMWFPNQNGEYTNNTDPRLNNDIVFEDTNSPFEGIAYNNFGATGSTVGPTQKNKVITGYTYSGKRSDSGGAFAPAAGISIEVSQDSFVYASYNQGFRMPSLFETSQGTLQTLPGESLKPERSSNWEIGASTLQKGVWRENDSAAIKLAYFDNTIKNYITRYYDPTPSLMGQMQFSNANSFKTRGVELQSHYDTGRAFVNFSSTYYLKTETCDSAFAATLRANANKYYRKTADTPNCTPGSYMGSYANTQNPPKFSGNLTTGLRFFDQSLTLGTRITYTSGPTVNANKPWQTGETTSQLKYREVTLVDLFANYTVKEDISLNLSIQNLTDRYYLDPLAQSFMPAPGRTLRIGTQIKF